jgi:seryl-tRNA synthetase
MLDLKFIRSNPEIVREKLKLRHYDEKLLDSFLSEDGQWRQNVKILDGARQKLKEISEKIGQVKRAGQKPDPKLTQEANNKSALVKTQEKLVKEIEIKLEKIILEFPNLPADSVPVGNSSEDNREIRRWGEFPKVANPRPHWEIGVVLGIFDFERAAKISGGRFVCLRGAGARLERALIDFMVNLHVGENGYTEVMPPALVNSKSMLGTGQLPKFDAELYKCRNSGPFAEDDYYLIPTAEVCVTNLHREEILERENLPINYVAYTPCFRREAGSYGQDTRGLVRVHQFNKVELVKFCEPAKSYEELETLLRDAELVLQKLNLPYRVVELCTADLGFGSAKTYDLEVWFPGSNCYREISSCSNFTDFQARRASIRYRPSPQAKPEFVHTLNGSGLAVGRTLAAILENFQQPDGKVSLPGVLGPYLSGLRFIG